MLVSKREDRSLFIPAELSTLFIRFSHSRREPTESPIFVGSNLKGEREKPETKHLQPIKEKLLKCACFVLFYREKRLIDIRISRLTSYTM